MFVGRLRERRLSSRNWYSVGERFSWDTKPIEKFESLMCGLVNWLGVMWKMLREFFVREFFVRGKLLKGKIVKGKNCVYSVLFLLVSYSSVFKS